MEDLTREDFAWINERQYSDGLAAKLNGRREVRTPAGRIDILTECEVIEVKLIEGWKEAVGQVLIYGSYYPRLGKRIHLVGDKTEEKKDLIEIACARVGVRVTWAMEAITIPLPVKEIDLDAIEINRENLPPRFIKILELSKTKGWVSARDVQRCYDSKSCNKPSDIRLWFARLEMMDLGITRGVGRSMQFKYNKQ